MRSSSLAVPGIGLVAFVTLLTACPNKDRGIGMPGGPGTGGVKGDMAQTGSDGGDLSVSDDLAPADLRGPDFASSDLAVRDLMSTDLVSGPSPDLRSTDLAGPGGIGAPLVGQCVTDNDCGGEECNPFFPGGRCLSCLSCPTGTTCNPNAGVCTQDCTDCGDTLSCGTVGGEELCINPSCSSNADCPAIYECRILSGAGPSSTKYCQRRLCTGPSDLSCPTGTDCRQYAGSIYVCVETALFN